MKKLNKKGFTLIELLAVIVILGVILIIAIPSISAAILNARKNSYVDTAAQLVDGVRLATLSNPSVLPGCGGSKYVRLDAIKLEKGSNSKSPFGSDYYITGEEEGANNKASYVLIKGESGVEGEACSSSNLDYKYYACLIDKKGNGFSDGTGGVNPIEITKLKTSDVSVGSADCDKPTTFDYITSSDLYEQ